MVEEARSALLDLGAVVFSPIHDVGVGDAHVVANADLAGLLDSAVVLALADGVDLGTIFEVGYAHAYKIQVLVFTERLADYQLTMIKGSGCTIETDFATALYKAVWASLT